MIIHFQCHFGGSRNLETYLFVWCFLFGDLFPQFADQISIVRLTGYSTTEPISETQEFTLSVPGSGI